MPFGTPPAPTTGSKRAVLRSAYQGVYGASTEHPLRTWARSALAHNPMPSVPIAGATQRQGPIPGRQRPALQQQPRDVRNGSNGLRGAANATSNRPNSSQFREIASPTELPSPEATTWKIVDRYFGAPVPFKLDRGEDGKLQPVLEVQIARELPQSLESTDRVYKLSAPIWPCEKTHSVMKSQIECIKLALTKDNLYAPRALPPTRSSQGNSTKISSGNESFELSFDGKALDRSDIFRMVDSFSVALEDDDDDEFQHRHNNRILPAEIQMF